MLKNQNNINHISRKLNGIKDQATVLVSKLQAGTATKKEIDALKILTEENAKTMQTTLNAIKTQYKDQVSAEAAANYQKMIDEQKANATKLANFTPASPATEVTGSLTALANIKPAEMEKETKALQPLEVEYNGRKYKNGQIIILTKTEEVSSFSLKNAVEGESLSWIIKKENTVLHNYTANPIGLAWPESATELKVEATQGNRKINLTLKRKTFMFKELYAVDANRPARKAKSGEKLYLVGKSFNGAALVTNTSFQQRKVNYVIESTADKTDIPSLDSKWDFFTMDSRGVAIEKQENVALPSLSTSKTYSKFVKDGYFATTATFAGTVKNAQVEVVDLDLTNDEKSIKFNFRDELAYALDMADIAQRYLPKGMGKVINNKNEWLKAGTKEDGFTIFIQPKVVATSFNEEVKDKRLYYRKTDHYLSVEAGLQGETPDIPVPSMAFPKLKASLFGYSFEAYAGVFVKLSGKASGDIGLSYRKYDYVENKALNTEKLIVYPAKISLEVKGSIAAKGKAEIKDGATTLVKGEVGGEASVAGEILSIIYDSDKKEFIPTIPLLEKGIRFRIEAKAKAKYKDYPPYEHIFFRGEAYWKP